MNPLFKTDYLILHFITVHEYNARFNLLYKTLSIVIDIREEFLQERLNVLKQLHLIKEENGLYNLTIEGLMLVEDTLFNNEIFGSL